MASPAVEVRVVRAWPSGPPRGAVITPPEPRRRQLLAGGFVELVSEPFRPPRKRGSAAKPETAEPDLLEQRMTR